MKILLTNDDGINAEGIKTLQKILSKDNEVFVLAPSENRSAVSHHVIMARPVPLHRISETEYAHDGFPADCVITGVRSKLLPWTPDVIVSGINNGANLGTDVIYSGTCGAARQGALYGIPSVAVSLNCDWSRKEHNYTTIAEFVAANIAKLTGLCGNEKLPDGSRKYYVSVNASEVTQYKGVKLGSYSYRDYGDRVSVEKDENGSLFSRFVYGTSQTLGEEENEYNLVNKGYLTLTLWYTNPRCETEVSFDTEGFILNKG